MVAASEGWQHQKDGKVEGTRMVAAAEGWQRKREGRVRRGSIRRMAAEEGGKVEGSRRVVA